MVTWKFKNGHLYSRTDHKIPSNKNNDAKIKKYHQRLLAINSKLELSPDNAKLLYQQAIARNILGNSLLALDASLKLIEMEHIRTKAKVTLYEILAQVYSTYENEDYSIHFRVKAIEYAERKTLLQPWGKLLSN
jgi:hypothetical protein